MTDDVLDFLRKKFARIDERFDGVQNDLLVMKNDLRIVKDDMVVTASILHRLEVKQDVMLDELRALYPQINRLGKRIDALEQA